jgi:imidazole glycerol-phosphate synthase subunit HisH
MNIHIVDYGMGNIFSVQKKLLQENVRVSISSDHQDILKADKIILLGVGHFKKAMDNLRELNLIEPLNDFVLKDKKPILGICLGMQLMANFSQEGNANGFGWIDASVKKFQTSDSKRIKIPHMGWNTIKFLKHSPLMDGLSQDEEFYFVHSFYLEPNNAELMLNETMYIDKFCSGIQKENIFGVQYHPEKSHDAGRTLLKNFISL